MFGPVGAPSTLDVKDALMIFSRGGGEQNFYTYIVVRRERKIDLTLFTVLEDSLVLPHGKKL